MREATIDKEEDEEIKALGDVSRLSVAAVLILQDIKKGIRAQLLSWAKDPGMPLEEKMWKSESWLLQKTYSWSRSALRVEGVGKLVGLQEQKRMVRQLLAQWHPDKCLNKVGDSWCNFSLKFCESQNGVAECEQLDIFLDQFQWVGRLPRNRHIGPTATRIFQFIQEEADGSMWEDAEEWEGLQRYSRKMVKKTKNNILELFVRISLYLQSGFF